MTTARRHDALAVAILALLPTVLFLDVLTGARGFHLRDLAHYNEPLKHVLREIVLGGEFPFWNRYVGGGQPLAANPQHEVFYPLTWLILLPDYFRGFQLLILTHVYVGLFSMYALLRSMSLRVPAAFAGATAFGLGGICMSYVNLLPFLFCAVWMPLTLLFARRLLTHPSWRSFALASLFFGLQLLVGEPTTIAQTAALLVAFATWRAFTAAGPDRHASAGRRLARNLGLAAAVLAAGAAAGAVQLVPALDHASDSVRSLAFHFRLVGDWSMPPHRLLELFYPNFFGVPLGDEPRYWGRHAYGARSAPFLYSIYPGLLAASLATAGLFVRQRGRALFLAVLSGSALLAIGRHTPLLRMLYDAGIAESVRYPEKFILAGGFALVVFSATTLDRLLEGDGAVRRAVLRVLGVIGGLSLLAAAASFTGAYATAFASFWDVTAAELPSRVTLSRSGWTVAALRAAALMGLVYALPKMRRTLWLALGATFLLADLTPVMTRITPRLPAAFFTETPAAVAPLRHALADRYRLFHESQWTEDEAMRRILRSGAASYWLLREGLHAATPVRYGIQMAMDQDVDRTSLLPTAYFTAAFRQAVRSGRPDAWRPFAAMSNVRVRAALQAPSAGGGAPVRLQDAGGHPRYAFASRVVSIGHARDFSSLLATGRFDGTEAFVPIPAFVPARGVVRSWRETANTATLDVETAGTGFLVMSVTPHKYWRVLLDGTRVEPVLTNLGYQGIVVPPGRHRVTMRYRNTLMVRCALLSALAATVLLTLVAVRPSSARIPAP